MQIALVAMVLVPLFGGVAISLLSGSRPSWSRNAALSLSCVVFGLAAWMWVSFDRASSAIQFSLALPWVPALNTSMHLGVDGVSMPMVLLTALLTVVAVLASRGIEDRVREYHTLLLLLEAGLIGVFVALDLIAFFLFWEVVLIPMYFLIAIWGGPRRSYASVKFFIYTLAGSMAMLAGIITLYLRTGASTFDIVEIAPLAATIDPGTQTVIFAAIAIGLAIKVPMFPLHTWLPDAHVEAPTAVSVLLAGVLLKMGSYGFLRFGPSMLPHGFEAARPFIAALALVSIVYGAAVALMQSDLKRLVAYSSVSHMGYVMLGIAAGTATAISGAVVQMFSHGLIAGLLFLLVGTVYERTHTREIAEYGGIAKVTPLIAGAFVFASFASLGLPGLSGFVGESMVVIGSFEEFRLHSVLASGAVMLTVGYLLWMLQRVVFGPVNEHRLAMTDMTVREAFAIAPLAALTLVVGVAPQTLIGVARASVELLAR
ncbi:MAG: NADH-quinone oxidoreductase subunit M [Actinobacteria bacterium]|nr:MAG: NADH-quinone oxidoreductase subunit M [Actinomycetota bacterium]